MIWNERRWGNPLPQDYASRLARADDTVNMLAGKLERARADRAKLIGSEARIQRFRDSVNQFMEDSADGSRCDCCCCKVAR